MNMRLKFLNMNLGTHRYKSLLLIVWLCFFQACSFNRTYNDREEDKTVGEKVLSQLFENVKNHQYDNNLELYSDTFWTTISREKMIQAYNNLTCHKNN